MPMLLASSARLKFSIRSKYTFQYSALVVQERVTKFSEEGAISFRRTVTPLACMMRLSAAITSPSTFFTTSMSAL
ncbi:hypothetical protein D3C81_1937610 [compost metagenome]